MTFEGIINTRSRGVIHLDGTLPHNLKVDEEVISEDTHLQVINDNGVGCHFRGDSAIAFLKIELDQIPKHTLH